MMRNVVLVFGLLVANGAAAQTTLTYDPLFVWYELESHSSSRNGRPVDEGYTISGRHRMMGQAPAGSFFRVVVRAGRRRLAEMRCPTQNRFGDNPFSHTPTCHDRDQKLRHVGALTIEVYFVDGATDQEALQARHNVRVARKTRVRGGGERDAPRYHVEYATELHTGVLEVAQQGTAYIPGSRVYGGEGRLALILNVKRAEDAPRLYASTLRCSVDGQVIGAERIDREELNSVAVVETRMARRQMQRTDHRYIRYRLGLPIVWGVDEHRTGVMRLRAGQWQCDWRIAGETLRSFAFTVDSELNVTGRSANLPSPLQLVDLEVPRRTPLDAANTPRNLGRGTAFWGSVR